MAARRGAGTFLFVFLLNCWQDVQPWPTRRLSDSSSKDAENFKMLDDDIATVFDEILVREILEPGKEAFLQLQSPSTTLQSKMMKNKNVYTKERNFIAPKRHYEKQSSSENIDTLSFDDEEKETIFQIKSLEALEKIIGTLRKAIGTRLSKELKLKKNELGTR